MSRNFKVLDHRYDIGVQNQGQMYLKPVFVENENKCELESKAKVKYTYTTFTNFSMKYLVICKVYTDVSGIK